MHFDQQTFAILATGPSLTERDAEYVRTRCRAIAVCDAFRIAPWAECLVCNDADWWKETPGALAFEGRRFCGVGLKGCERIPRTHLFTYGLNSGLQGMRIAQLLGAKRLLLLGFDMHGAHFSEHPTPNKATSARRFAVHLSQFSKWGAAQAEINVINCAKNSALIRFPFGDLHELLP